MSKAILVTGSSGQLGREVVKQLREAGRNVIGIDLLPGSQTDHSIDIRDQGLVAEICQEADSIIHTAALHGRQVAAGLARRPFIEVNITGTFNLLEGALAAGHRRFLLTTSTSVYGQAMVHPDQAVWVDEDLTPQARDVYDITKLAAEGLCKDFWEKDGLSTVVLRPSRFLPEPPNVVANHRLYRGLDVSDAARGHILALDKEALPWGIFNLSASSPFQQNELVELKGDAARVIRRYYPKAEAAYEENGWHLPTSIDRVYVTEKARSVLGFEPLRDYESCW